MDTKAWYTSKSVWGSFMAIVASIAAISGIDFDAPVKDELADIFAGAGSLVGGALSLYGRFVAVTQLVFAKKEEKK